MKPYAEARITAKGRELLERLAPSVPYTRDAAAVCSLICRAAHTYQRLQVAQCERDLRPAERRREASLEDRVRDLCATLPRAEGDLIRPAFCGDPRGPTVKLLIPHGRTDDVCVPGS